MQHQINLRDFRMKLDKNCEPVERKERSNKVDY
jgi:hypothetical protein